MMEIRDIGVWPYLWAYPGTIPNLDPNFPGDIRQNTGTSTCITLVERGHADRSWLSAQWFFSLFFLYSPACGGWGS